MRLINQLFAFVFVSSPCLCLAQTENKNLWSNPNRQAKQQILKKGNKFSQFKNHLQKWGLDTNYKQGLAIGARLNSTGWTGLLYYQQRRSRTQNQFYQLSFSEIKHEKQIKQQRQNIAYPELGSSSPFIFGKINSVYQLQLGYGREMLLLPGVLDGNMTISLRWQGGLSVAALKPYYLKLIYLEYNPDEQAHIQEEKYSDENKEEFLKTGNILGASKWKKGLNEIDWIPGAYVDMAIAIEPLKNRFFIKTVTLGCNASFHSQNIEIMSLQKATPWNVCLYAGLSIGKRW